MCAAGDTDFIYPMISNTAFNYIPLSANMYFKASLWHNGTEIYNGIGDGQSTEENQSVLVSWSMLGQTLSQQNSGISITNQGECSIDEYSANQVNIVKCSVRYRGANIIATLPITWVTDLKTGFNIELVQNTGFRYAIYESDGRRPQYDNTLPFEIKVAQRINGYDEDISMTETSYKLTYSWSCYGHIQEQSRSKNQDVQRNQHFFKPEDVFEDDIFASGVKCTIKQGTTIIGNIDIPIHLMLNKYGHAAINDWDGNAVQVDKDGNGVILAPQAGFGSKNSDNSFNGIVMGKVKTGSLSNTGLFGYYQGQRTIFLNSDDGSATFGKTGAGQIIIDPSSNRAQIRSGNYSTSNGTGMLIDLSTPEIRFGSGNFSVDAAGNLESVSGHIGGFKIGATTLTSGSGSSAVGMASSGTYAFWTGSTVAGSAPFNVTNTGIIKMTEGSVYGNLYVEESGQITVAGNNKNTRLSKALLNFESNNRSLGTIVMGSIGDYSGLAICSGQEDDDDEGWIGFGHNAVIDEQGDLVHADLSTFYSQKPAILKGIADNIPETQAGYVHSGLFSLGGVTAFFGFYGTRFSYYGNGHNGYFSMFAAPSKFIFGTYAQASSATAEISTAGTTFYKPVECQSTLTVGGVNIGNELSNLSSSISSLSSTVSGFTSCSCSHDAESDARLKYDIENTQQKGLDTINQISIKQFNWKESDEFESFGFISNELEKIDESFVNDNPQYNEQGQIVDYIKEIKIAPLLAMNTKAIQELYEKIYEQEQIINYLLENNNIKKEDLNIKHLDDYQRTHSEITIEEYGKDFRRTEKGAIIIKTDFEKEEPIQHPAFDQQALEEKIKKVQEKFSLK